MEWLLVIVLVWRGSAIEIVPFPDEQQCQVAKVALMEMERELKMTCVPRYGTASEK